MNKSFYSKHILSMVALVLFSICFAACDSGSGFDVIGNPQTNQKLYATCNLATSSNTIELGEELTATVRLDVNQSSEGAEIKQVEFYLDDMFIQKATSSPFVLSYKTDNVSVGTHTLSVAIIVGGKNYEDITITKEATITVNAKEVQEPEEKEPEVGFYIAFPDLAINQYYTATAYLDINETSPGCYMKKIDFYLDNHLVETQTSMTMCSATFKIVNAAEEGYVTVKAIATIGGYGYKDKEVMAEQRVGVLHPNIGRWGYFLLLGKQRIIKNGDTMWCSMWRYGGSNVYDYSFPTYIVNLYWDNSLVRADSLIAQGYIMMDYTVSGASVGSHKLTIERILHHYDPVLKEYVIDGQSKEDETITVIE